MISTILFDLDGTLLPMDQDTFVKAYFGGLSKKAAPHGYDSKGLIQTVWAGTTAMIQNDGAKTNEAVFWDLFAKTYGSNALKDIVIFDHFYAHEFQEVQKVCGYLPQVPLLIEKLKAAGFRLILATNPIFPRVATESRTRWAGLQPEDFELITTYENSRYCKPNPAYYREILKQIHVAPEECLMVGNDVAEDMVTSTLGMSVFLLTDCLINKNETPIDKYPHGNIEDLISYLQDKLQISI